ncbi:Nif11-like leader peptide family RiPP precursor [Scatolibacter rhodanostii]|uniref:Nif11-like leader peptide family RiPP precursor n=1 Tax=Scatolibacter rhodanostii TaxID=2014781 RepID=UPI00135659CF|nr:Nif11-like leader peptide family RiPP precursor [Scatolibacter rhodanostii]
MNRQDFIQKLTEEQKMEFGKLSTAEEILNFAKQLGFDLDEKEILSALNELSDQNLDEVSGGVSHYTFHPFGDKKKFI